MVAWAFEAAVEIVQDREGLCTPAADAMEDQKKSQELALQEGHGLPTEWTDLVELLVAGVVGAAAVGWGEGGGAAEMKTSSFDLLDLEKEN